MTDPLAGGKLGWTKTAPQPTHPVTPLVKAARVLPAVLIFFFIFGGDGLTSEVGRVTALGLALAAAVVVGVASWLSWRRLTYWFDDEGDLRVHSGVLQRKERRVQLSRLQSVDVTQPLVARIFGLAAVRPEVAGSSSGATTLEYLTLRGRDETAVRTVGASCGNSGRGRGGCAGCAGDRADERPGRSSVGVRLVATADCRRAHSDPGLGDTSDRHR